MGYDLLRNVITERDFIYSIANDVALTVSGYGINVLWFFSGMIGAKLLYAISYKIKGKPPVPVFVVYLILGCVSILISGAIAGFLQGKFLVRCVGYVATAFLRSFTIVPFLAFGDLFGYKIAAWVKKKSIVISGLFVLTALIPALLRMKVTLVLNCSEPFFATYLFALPISVGVLGLSQKITEMKSFSSILRWFGKNSLFVMVIHEYTSVRSTIQQMVVCVVQPYWIQILLTLVFVLLACFLLRKILNQPYQMIMKRIDVFASEHMKTNIV